MRRLLLPLLLSYCLFGSAETWALDAARGLEHLPPPVFNVAPVIRECSASVMDEANDAVWTLGDSGNPALLGRTSMRDWITVPITVEGARNEDWEALVRARSGHLWILDVGDNDSIRKSVTLYEVDPAQSASESRSLHVLRAVTVIYPDGPRNVEGGVIDDSDRLYLFEKTNLGRPRVATVSVSAQAPELQVAFQYGRLPAIGPITDASVSPEGDVFLLTYLGIHRCNDCFDETRRSLRPVRAGFKGQIESLVALGSDRFWVASEDGAFYEW